MSDKRRGLVTLAVLVVVIAVVAAIAAYARKGQAASAKVGDCMQQTGTNSLKIIKCTDKNAKFVVVGRVENKTQIDASIGACSDFDNKGVVSSYWEGKDGVDEKGMVLCLANHTP